MLCGDFVEMWFSPATSVSLQAVRVVCTSTELNVADAYLSAADADVCLDLSFFSVSALKDHSSLSQTLLPFAFNFTQVCIQNDRIQNAVLCNASVVHVCKSLTIS